MLGRLAGRVPAIATKVIAPVKPVLRVVTAAYFSAAGAALMMQPPAVPLLGGLLAPEAAPVVAMLLFVPSACLLANLFVRSAASLLCVYMAVLIGVHAGLVGAPLALTALWGDLAVLLVLFALTGGSGGRTRQDIVPSNVAPFPWPHRTRQDRNARAYLAALPGAPDQWDRDAA